jgi:hypothetical protein
MHRTLPFLGASLLLACDGASPPAPPPRDAPLYACEACDAASARVPDGRGGTACVSVGASLDPTPDDPRALLPSLPLPLRYVAVDAPADGDGTRARPFPSIARALAVAAEGTLVLLAGRHALVSSVVARAPLAIVGAGVSLTTVVATTGAAFAATSSGATLTLARLTVTGGSAAVEASEGARVVLRDVVSREAAVAVAARGVGTVIVARGLTAERSSADGVVVEDGAALTLVASVVRQSAGYGVRSRAGMGEGGRVRLTRVLIDGARGYGVGLAGAVTSGAANTCATDDPEAIAGARDCLREVSVRGVVGVGVGVAGRRDLSLWRAHVCGTSAGVGVGTGDGIYVAVGARVGIDDESAAEGAAALGRGSWVVANARSGILVERTRPEVTDAAETVLTLRGAEVAYNGGPGVVLQRGAAARAINHARIDDNGGLGLGLTPGTRVDEILCDQFLGTRPAMLLTPEGPYLVADGLSMSGASAGRVDANEMSRNGRFGAVFGDADAVLTSNRGADNLYGVGNYAPGRVRIDVPSAITGRMVAPVTRPPLVQGTM